jgi:hypothetical protein
MKKTGLVTYLRDVSSTLRESQIHKLRTSHWNRKIVGEADRLSPLKAEVLQ